MSSQQHIPRLFIPLGDSATVDSHGLPVWPDEFYTSIEQAEWEKWQDADCLVLLGEPGCGKSTEFDHQHQALVHSGQYSFLIPLGGYFSGCALSDLVDDKARWNTWQTDHQAVAYLFLDSLDEGRLDFPQVLNAVAAQIRSLPYARLKLRLSCRIRDWRSTDTSSLARLFPKKENSPDERATGVTELEVLGLHWSAIREKAERDSKNAEAFLSRARELKILSLCAHPLLLKFLLEQFTETDQIGRTKAEIYSSAIDRMLGEDSPRHGRAKTFTTPATRRKIAAKIATLAMLGGRESLYVPDFDQPGDDKSLDVTLSGEIKDALWEALDTKLFTGGRRGEFRFYHRSMAEFLAAEFIGGRLREGLSFLQIKPLLFGENGIPTPLRGVMGWLATIDAKARNECIHADPLLVFEGGVASFDIASKETAIMLLKQRFQGMDFQNEVRDYGELASGCNQNLLTGLLEKGNSGAVRMMALDLIGDGRVDELFGLVLKVALDKEEEQWLRAHATMIVAKDGGAAQKTALKQLLHLSPEEDPNDEVAGIILDGLFPACMTMVEALDVLHVARNPNMTGMYRLFWHSRFDKQLQDEDLGVALPRIYALIAQAEEGCWSDYANSYIPELFGRLAVRYLVVTLQPDVRVIAPWLDLFKDSGPLECSHHGNDVKRQIVAWLQPRPEMKSVLLQWALERNPPSEKNRFGIWDVAFPEDAWEIGDFEWLCEEAKAESSSANQHALFDVAWMLWGRNGYLPVSYFERMEELAGLNPQSSEMWRNGLVDDINSSPGHWRRKARERRKEGEKQREENCRHVQGACEPIADAKAEYLEFLSSFMHEKGIELFGLPSFTVLEEEFGGEVRNAAEAGFAKAWDEAAISDLEVVWRDNAIPWKRIAIGYAIEAAWHAQRIDWVKVSSGQVEAAVLIAAKHHNDFPGWFEPLYRARKDVVERLLDRILAVETKDAESNAWLCGRIEYSKILQPELCDYAQRYLFSHDSPENKRALSALLTIAIRLPSEELTRYIEKQARRAFDRRRKLSEGKSSLVMLFVAAWWLLDWQPAWRFLVKKALMGKDTGESLLAFVGAVREMVHTVSFSDAWPESIPIEANIDLVPYLYAALPPEEDPKIEGTHRVDVRESLSRFRDQIVSLVSTGTPQIAKQAFIKWMREPEFARHKTWYQQIVRDLDRRMVDDAWRIPDQYQIAEVIFRDGRLIRNGADLFSILEDVLDSWMRDKLVDEASLVPHLLWEGSKRNGRKPTDEKPLQQLLANQLKLLLKGMPVIGAREPEVFDAKKPDFRVSAVLVNGDSVEIPIEVKQAHAVDVWSAPLSQLLAKYMKPSNTNHGIYLVGWYGGEVSHPVTKAKYMAPLLFESALQEYVNGEIAGKNKQIAVFVYDVRVGDGGKIS